MKPRSTAALGLLLLLGTATWAQGPAPKPWTPQTPPSRPATTTKAKPQRLGTPEKKVNYYNGMPDTGEFLVDSVEIGRIDNRIFRVGEFRDRWNAAYPLDRPRADSSGLYEFLNSMVNKEVLADLARKVNVPLTYEDRQTLRETETRAKSNAVFARLVADSVHVSKDEVMHLYEQSKFELHLQSLLTNDLRTAQQAREDVVSGRLSWSAAYKKYAMPDPDVGPDGDMGWQARTAFNPEPALEIFDLADGQCSGALKEGSGWKIIRVVGRRSVFQPSFETLSHALGTQVMQIKLNQRSEQVRDEVRHQIGLAYDSTNIAWAVARFAAANPPDTTHPREKVIDAGRVAPDFQPEDTSRVLARWNGGSYSLGSFLQVYTDMPPITRPQVEVFRSFRETLDGFVLEPFMARLADDRGLANDPIVVDEMKKKEEELRVVHLFADSVESKVRVTAAMRKKYYDDHPSDYYTWQTIGYAAIIRHSKAGADSLVQRLKHGESAIAILRADSLSGFVSGSLKTANEQDHEPVWKLLAEEVQVGGVDVEGPDPQGDYLVMQKLSHDHGHRLALPEVASMVDESVQNIAAETALKAFIARYRPAHTVVLHPERLMFIKLYE